MNQGDEGFDCFVIESGQAFASIIIAGESKEVKQYEEGGFFGERALLRAEPRAATVTARTNVSALRMHKPDFANMIRERDHKENIIRNVKMFETMNEDQVAKIASALERKIFNKGETIMKQGEPGEHFYIVEEGECDCTIKQGDSEQSVKKYMA